MTHTHRRAMGKMMWMDTIIEQIESVSGSRLPGRSHAIALRVGGQRLGKYYEAGLKISHRSPGDVDGPKAFERPPQKIVLGDILSNCTL